MPEAQRLDKTVDKHAGPLLGSKNRLKLAVFGTNLSGGAGIGAHPVPAQRRTGEHRGRRRAAEHPDPRRKRQRCLPV
jgi:hypothetical protein